MSKLGLQLVQKVKLFKANDLEHNVSNIIPFPGTVTQSSAGHLKHSPTWEQLFKASFPYEKVLPFTCYIDIDYLYPLHFQTEKPHLVTNYLKCKHSSPSPKFCCIKVHMKYCEQKAEKPVGILVLTWIEPDFFPIASTFPSFFLFSFIFILNQPKALTLQSRCAKSTHGRTVYL